MRILYVTKLQKEDIANGKSGYYFFTKQHLLSLSNFSKVDIFEMDLINAPGFFGALNRAYSKKLGAQSVNAYQTENNWLSPFWIKLMSYRLILSTFGRLSAAIRTWVKDVLIEKKPDVVICDNLYNAALLINPCKTLKLPLVLCEQNIEWKFNSYMFKNKFFEHLLKNVELDILKQVDGCFFVSKKDLQIAIDYGIDKSKLYFLPMTHQTGIDNRKKIHKLTVGQTKLMTISFLGSSFKPNVEFVSWLINDLAPKFCSEPVQFLVMGNVCDKFKDKEIPKNVKMLGYVADTTKYLRSSQLFLAPVLSMGAGAGAQSKLAFPISLGLPILTNTNGALGYGLEHMKNCIISDDVESYPNLIKSLYADKNLLQKLSKNIAQFQKDNIYLTSEGQAEFLNGIINRRG